MLATKVTAPAQRGRLVVRSRLQRLLEAALDEGVRLALVSAPAGFGKSTLVSSWVAETTSARGASVSAMWLSLDDGDNDTARFLAHLGAAVASCGVTVPTEAVASVEGNIDHLLIDDDHLVGVQMTDGTTVPRDALFVPPRFVPNHSLLASLGCDLDDNGWVRVDGTGRTSNPHVWAAGNVVDPRAQVITAAGAGSAAAIALNADLVDEDVRAAVHAFTHGNTA